MAGTMTTEQVLGRMRRLLGQVDIATSVYEDQELLEAAEDCRRVLVSRGWSTADDYAIVVLEDETGYGITPDPEDPMGGDFRPRRSHRATLADVPSAYSAGGTRHFLAVGSRGRVDHLGRESLPRRDSSDGEGLLGTRVYRPIHHGRV